MRVVDSGAVLRAWRRGKLCDSAEEAPDGQTFTYGSGPNGRRRSGALIWRTAGPGEEILYVNSHQLLGIMR